jgi:hypothetical protein
MRSASFAPAESAGSIRGWSTLTPRIKASLIASFVAIIKMVRGVRHLLAFWLSPFSVLQVANFLYLCF